MNGIKYVVVDIDGTMSIVGSRLRFLEQEKKDWDSFYDAVEEDEPNTPVVELVKILKDHYKIIFSTGRVERVRGATVRQLKKFLGEDFPYEAIIMRPNYDRRTDMELKPDRLPLTPAQVAFILEDRKQMVDKWRELGFTCLQVAGGDY